MMGVLLLFYCIKQKGALYRKLSHFFILLMIINLHCSRLHNCVVSGKCIESLYVTCMACENRACEHSKVTTYSKLFHDYMTMKFSKFSSVYLALQCKLQNANTQFQHLNMTY